jgi:hypothetical protein
VISFPGVAEFMTAQLKGERAVRVWVFDLEGDDAIHAIGCDRRGTFLHFRSTRFVDVVEWAVGLTKD